MTDTGTITASLERYLQNCSLSGKGGGVGGGVSKSATLDRPENVSNAETTVELSSHVALPCQWEQCLDLKTREIYYVDWKKGTKAKEDPRRTERYGGDFCSDEDSLYDSESSSSASSPSSRDDYRDGGDHVLVVAGCKRCLMYFMLPKQVEECPKCSGLILHFDRSENGSP